MTSLSTIAQVADDIEAVIAALTPDVEPDRKWALYHGGGSLEAVTLEADEDKLRLFQALPDIDARLGRDHLNNNLAHMEQSIVIELRYRVPLNQGRTLRGWRRASRLAGCDVAQIAHALTSTWSWASVGIEEMTLDRDGRLKPIGIDSYYARLRARPQYPYPVTSEDI